MTTAIIFTILFAISGIMISEVVFEKHKFANRIWLGLAIGLLLMTWLPCLLAFAMGFTVTAQILSAFTAVLSAIACTVVLFVRKRKGKKNSYTFGRDWFVLLPAIPIVILCGYLLHTHILNRHADGSLWVGQVTYGDLAMHLGFITSIAEQKLFPPQYSIFPGHALNYPFLCETSGASLYQLGASVREAYILSALYAFVLVVFGVYRFFEQWLKRRSRAAFATILFFFGSGFGFFYFFDLSKSGGLLSQALGTHGQTVSELLLDGFYMTPTNIPALGLRWVNPIVDMLIPQRATLFGWAFLFPCLYLLHGFTFEKKRENLIPLAVIAGSMPLIHTHSFLALGIVSAVYCVTDLITVRFEKKRTVAWGVYALIACALAAPQLFLFTFRQTTESNMVRLHLNWANEADSFLWFYIKNFGLIFLLMPFAFMILPKRDKKIYAGALLIWIISELIIFQPNAYDNNKLLFVWYAFTCGLVSKAIFTIGKRASFLIAQKYSARDRVHTHSICIAAVSGMFFLYLMFKLAFDSEGGVFIKPGTALTLFVSAGLLLALCIGAIRHSIRAHHFESWLLAPLVLSVWMMALLFAVWITEYRNKAYEFGVPYAALASILCLLVLILYIRILLADAQNGSVRSKFCGSSAALTVGLYLLVFTMTVSSFMTIIRECKSEYQVYTKNEAELSEQIKEITSPDDVILSNDYHWNLVTPLTGRSIVTGTATFLYYHGIDTSEREAHVAQMFENPADHADLFERYGIRYILISNAERGNYDIDYAYFNQHGTVAAETPAGRLYRLDP